MKYIDVDNVDLQLKNLIGTTKAFEVKWTKFNGITFKVDTAAQFVGNLEYPVFGLINNIICTENNKILFSCKQVKVLHFDPTLTAFMVSLDTNKFEYIFLENLAEIQSYKIHLLPGGHYAINLNKV